MNRTKDKDSNIIGTYNPDPILNTIVYDVMFPDGSVSKYSANLIAENLYSQVDEEGHHYQLLDHISNHRKDYIAVRDSETWIVSKNGRRNRKSTTKGWYLEAQWRDGSSSWVPLKEIKENYSVLVAEYAQTNEIINEPVFAWRAPHVLKKLNQIIFKNKI